MLPDSEQNLREFETLPELTVSSCASPRSYPYSLYKRSQDSVRVSGPPGIQGIHSTQSLARG